MSKNTFYLKYRPFQLDDMVGQFYTVSTFKQASINKRFVHSYLFGGIKGTGKTSIARIVANLINCENPVNGSLCGKCIACTKIHDGSAVDIVELDGAKNGNVEHIQALIDSARWSPSEFKKKIYIIDEAQQLTDRAISALLKIVEEPPEHVVFIFCTTDVDKIPGTILSRSQKYTFSRIAAKDMVSRLRYIAENESIKITDSALYAIAKIGRGSMRDSIGCLEQIYTASGNNSVDESAVYKYYGMADRKGVFEIVKSIVECNVSLLMDQVNDLMMSNADAKSILYEVSELFRSLMVMKAQKGVTKLIDLPDHEIQLLGTLGSSIKFSQLEKLSKAFSTIEKELEYSINKRWVMESTLLKCSAYLRQ